jgi:hypothetical protein
MDWSRKLIWGKRFMIGESIIGRRTGAVFYINISWSTFNFSLITRKEMDGKGPVCARTLS